MALLEVAGIDVYYGAVQALRGVSLQVEAGERVAVLGANGAGKTTTLRTISGLLSPVAGRIRFDGREIAGLPAYEVVSRGITHGPEGRALFPGLSVAENLRFGYLPRLREASDGGERQPAWDRVRASLRNVSSFRPRLPEGGVRRLLEWTPGKEDDDYHRQLEWVFGYFPPLKERRSQAAGTLSGGEQQMLVVARALMSAPKLLIVDELSLGLAPKVVALLFDIIREVNREGTAVLIVEQFVHMALANTHRAYVLAKGEVVLEGPSAELAESEDLVASYLGGGTQAQTSRSTDRATAGARRGTTGSSPKSRHRRKRSGAR